MLDPEQVRDGEKFVRHHGEERMEESEGLSLKALILGFIAGAIATLTVHELVKGVFFDAGVIALKPWDMTPIDSGPFAGSLPKIASATLWGGVWGALMGMAFGREPEGSMTLRGLAFGITGPALIGVFLLVPLFKGTAPFLGGNLEAMGAVLCILAAWGAVAAWLLGLFSYSRLP
jgi:hypothetical protein